MPRQSNVTLSVLGKCIPNFAQKYRKQKIGDQAFYGVIIEKLCLDPDQILSLFPGYSPDSHSTFQI
jgi:hypothetical protein